MSEQNVELVRRAWEAWIRGDTDALLDYCDTAVEWGTTERWPEDDVYYGHEGVRRFLQQWRASWEHYETGVEEFIDLDDDRVLVLCWQRGFGPDSHVPVQMDWAQITTLKRGLLVRLEAYSDRRVAFEAAGLSE
jgi:ketosteroid isomerase-like protein